MTDAEVIGAVDGVLGAPVTPWMVGQMDRWAVQLTGLGLCAAVDILLAPFPSTATVALAWGGAGFGFALWGMVSLSARQRVVQPEILARTNGAARTISLSAIPLSVLTGAWPPTDSGWLRRYSSAASHWSFCSWCTRRSATATGTCCASPLQPPPRERIHPSRWGTARSEGLPCSACGPRADRDSVPNGGRGTVTVAE